MRTKSTTDKRKVEKVTRFQIDSTEDYIAARTLLLANLPLQGAILGSTALEKAFKMLLAFFNQEVHGHLKQAHWKAAFNRAPYLERWIRTDFLELNKKVYEARYKESLTNGYNIAIAVREYLWELDQTILLIHQQLRQKSLDDKPRITMLEHLISTQDQRVTMVNHFAVKREWKAFDFSTLQDVVELRMHNGLVMQVQYATKSAPKDKSFIRTALAPESDNRTFTMAFESIPEEPALREE